jgi:hypothetical protein
VEEELVEELQNWSLWNEKQMLKILFLNW